MGMTINDAGLKLRGALNLPGFDVPGVSQAEAKALEGLLSLFPDVLASSGPSAFSNSRAMPYLPCPQGYSAFALSNALAFLGRCPCTPSLGQLGPASFGMGLSFQALFLQASIVPVKANKVDTPQSDAPDKFATHQSCRTGLDNPNNLNDADHLKLAIYETLQRSSGTRGEFKAMAPEELQKKLKEDYGIESELTKIKTKSGDEITGLKFKNGKVFCDAAGDGKLDTGDYNFKGAIEDMKTRLGLGDEDLGKVDEAMRASFKQQKELMAELEKVPGFKDLPADMKDQYTRLLSGGRFDPNAAEAAFQQATGTGQQGWALNLQGFGVSGGFAMSQGFGGYGMQQGFGFPPNVGMNPGFGMSGGQMQLSIFVMMMQAYQLAS
ncbi:hypothetical protein L6R52_43335 [Myxococcota bacterium]|nr:hypothetical protein [Myxococcota bacterium]